MRIGLALAFFNPALWFARGKLALEREIAVRRVEHDVEELERLRRIDETRRREDAERLRRQLEQSPPPLPFAPATPPGRAARPG